VLALELFIEVISLVGTDYEYAVYCCPTLKLCPVLSGVISTVYHLKPSTAKTTRLLSYNFMY